ncbi:MAG: ATP-dependent helicase, partial [Promethearchaeota archaeon]
KKIRHVLVDEYQDVNSIQSKIIDQLASEAKSLTVVGDDAQAIYRFRGADFTHMLEFPTRYPDYSEYKLEENYRSSPEILKLANKSIHQNTRQFKKTLFTSRESGEKPALVSCEDREQEAQVISSEILRYREEGIQLHEQAVLFRAGFHASALELELNRHNIPYEIRAGVRFFERGHIKDFLSMLILISNPSDIIQWMRLISLHEGLSATSAQKVMNGFEKDKNKLESFLNTDYRTALKGKRVMKKGIANLERLQEIYKKNICFAKQKIDDGYYILPSSKFPPLPSIAEKFIKYLEPIIKQNYHDRKPEERIMELRELINFIRPYNSLNVFLADVLTQYDLEGRSINDGSDFEEEKPLILSTIHQAKGLEWEVVFVMTLVEGQFPNAKCIGDPDEIEEERRIFYVACTRAKNHLILTYPRFFPTYSVDLIQGPSRFITEIKKNRVYENISIEESNQF